MVNLDPEKANAIIRSLPYEQGFHFFSPDGHYTGNTATTLCFFQQILQHIDIESIRFHLYRGDFGKWLNMVIGDHELAEKIGAIDQKTSDWALREQLVDIVQKRIVEIKKLIP